MADAATLEIFNHENRKLHECVSKMMDQSLD